jgi:hypothetical protein
LSVDERRFIVSGYSPEGWCKIRDETLKDWTRLSDMPFIFSVQESLG